MPNPLGGRSPRPTGRMISRRPLPTSTHLIQLDRRQRQHLQKMETDAILAHRELVLRREHAQAQMLADTALAQTAGACIVGNIGFNAVLRSAVPEASAALALIEATHAGKLAQRLDDFE